MAIETYDITADLSDQDIYVSVLRDDTIDAGLSTLTTVDANAKGNANKVRFHFPSPLSGPDKTTLDGVVAAYDPAGTQPVASPEAELVIEDVEASANEKVWGVTTTASTLKVGTCTDAGVAANSAIEATRTGTTVDSVSIGAPLTVSGEVTADTPTSGTSLTTKSYVDARDQGIEWQDSVLSVLNTPPGSPTTDDRHLVGTSPTGDYATHADEFATYNGSTWDFQVPTKGTSVVVDTPHSQINYNGTSWIDLGSIVNHANLINLTVGDPHTQYQKESEKNAASGYAGLDGSSKLTGTQQVYGSAVNTACVGNDARLSDSRTPSTHASSHSDGGSDEITIENLATSGASGKVPTSNGSGGLTMETPAGGVFGSELNLAESTGDADSTDTTLISKVRLPSSGDITLAAGTYLLTVSYMIRVLSSGGEYDMQILQGGSLLGTAIEEDLQDNTNKVPRTRVYHLVLTAGDYNWEVKFAAGGSYTARMSDTYISIWRLL